MKPHVLVLAILFFHLPFALTGQLKTPAPSPLAETRQQVGLTEITLVYMVERKTHWSSADGM